MSWPLSQDYNEAIQSPRSNFTDADLQRGEAVANALGLPMPYSGNFADVYQVRCPDGKSWAVKCFTRDALGLRERYQEISAHLKQAKLPFSVDFSYLVKGIRVAGKWYPVLKMQWVEGLTLNQFVGQYLDKPAMLEALLQLWARMGKFLRAADIAHCDLQHGNVLLVPGATPKSLALKLIDYDGMWVPALAGKNSGEVGHANYQHPQRLREETFSLEVDRFPLLLVATAMRALKADKALWAKYDNGDNMLFKESDLAAPGRSELFEELSSLPDPGLVMLAAQVRAALKGGLESAALLEDAMPDAKGAATPAPRKATRPAPVTASALPSRLGQTTAPMAAQVVAEAPVAAGALDFDGPAPGLNQTKGKRARTKSPAVPMKFWISATIAAVAVIGLVAGLAAWAMSGSPNQPKTATPNPRVAQKDADAIPPPDPKPEPHENKDKGVVPAQNDLLTDPNLPKPQPPLEHGITNTIGMKLILIPAGKFTMGSPAAEPGRNADEGPQHEVEITRAFYMGEFTVMKGQFAAFVKEDGYKTELEREGSKETWRSLPFDQTDDHPVVAVTWNDAARFCEWLSKKEGKRYELPTEAEWEYACRAGTKTAYFFGGDPNGLDDYAWYSNNSGNHTHPVGGKKSNPWGLYDMVGNVWQWCQGAKGPYQGGYFEDPQDPYNGKGRVGRGGSWNFDARYCRSAIRGGNAPGGRGGNLGFRVVLRPGVQTP